MRGARAIAVVFLAVVALAAAAPELWGPAHYETQFRDFPDASPSARFPLGTDDLGRDRLTRLLYGTRVSLLLAPAAALLSCFGAAVLGVAAGLAGGLLEIAILGAADLFLSLPWLFLLLTVRACLPLNLSPGASVTVTFILLGALGWAAPARILRGAVTRLRKSEFMLFARASGCSQARLMWAHLLPNVKPILLAQLWVAIPVYILAEATLGMLGMGVAEPLPSLGGILRELENGGAILSRPWLLAPAILLAAVVASFQLVLPREDYSV